MNKLQAKIDRISAYLHAELDGSNELTYTFTVVPRDGAGKLRQLGYGPADEILTSLTMMLADAAVKSDMKKSQILDALGTAYDYEMGKQGKDDDSDMEIDADVSIAGVNLATGETLGGEEALMKLAEALQIMAKKKKNGSK